MKYAIVFVLTNTSKYAFICYHLLYAEIRSYLACSIQMITLHLISPHFRCWARFTKASLRSSDQTGAANRTSSTRCSSSSDTGHRRSGPRRSVFSSTTRKNIRMSGERLQLRTQGQDSPSSTITVFSTSRFFHWKSDRQRLR